MSSTTDVAQSGPLVSVLTPSYGQAQWLEDNLRSVEAQTYQPIEHVVMDGGSVDGTIAILERRSRSGLVWVSEPDNGQSDAINRAFARSSGEIIGWLNSDDAYFGRDVVAEAVAAFAADPSIAVVYGHGALVDARGRILHALWAPSHNPTLLRLHDYVVQPAAFVRRSVVGPLLVDPGFDFSMDYELFLRLARRHRFQRLDRIVAIDRHHAARKSYTMVATSRADHARLVERYGIAHGLIGRLGRKIWKILSRLAGVRLIPVLRAEEVVFAATGRSGRLALLRRQVAALRAGMDTGEP